MRLCVRFVEQRFGAKHAIIWKRGATEHNAVRADKAIAANLDWAGNLSIELNIDGVRNELRLEPGNSGEAADGDRAGAIQ